MSSRFAASPSAKTEHEAATEPPTLFTNSKTALRDSPVLITSSTTRTFLSLIV